MDREQRGAAPPGDGPRTRDGVPFVPGMTLVAESGSERETGGVEVTVWHATFDIEGAARPFAGWMIGRKGSGVGTDLRMYYSGHRARVAAILADLEECRDVLDRDIARLRGLLASGDAAALRTTQAADLESHGILN